MPRSERYQEAAGFYHVTARGVRRQPIYRDPHDYEYFSRLFHWIRTDHGWKCVAYAWMPNHFHAVLQIVESNLSQGMHRLNFRHADRFNRRHDLTGHVFERRFYSNPIESEEYLREAIRYVVLNPVRAGLCPHPGLWPWSSYAATVGRRRSDLVDADTALAFFDDDPVVFARYVAEVMAVA